jgi:hypothetical protein
MMELVYGVVLGCWLGLRLGWDYYIGVILEMYHKLGPWNFALVVSVPITCTNYMVILLFISSNQTNCTVTLQLAGKSCQGQTLHLTEPILKLWRQ